MTAPLTGVALCRRFDLVALFGEAFAAVAPHLRLVAPADVADPLSVAFALSFDPPDDAFAAYPNLRAVVGIGAGVERILACPSRPPGAVVVRMIDPDQADQMAAFAVWHVIYWLRGFDRMLAAQARGEWASPGFAPSPKGFPVGVFGAGNLGRRVAEACLHLGHPVRSFTRRPPARPVPGAEAFHGEGLDAFLAGTRCLIAVLPHTPATEGILNRALFERLPRGAYLVNIGRGANLVEEDLIPALDAGLLAGASLDVFRTEPLPADHPFWADPRIVVTPHAASDPAPEAVALSAARALEALAEGREPPGLVDPATGY